MGFWFFVWTLAAPMTLATGAGSVVLVVLARTRTAGRILAGCAGIAGVALTLLFAHAHEVARNSEGHAYDLISPEERARMALVNGCMSLTGLAVGLMALALAFRLSQRTSVPPS
ncbi:MAG TPA: hypothetical protein VER96_35575 [Polyangiaceae bacterium]|nr:hypothetical protein [Polyangiaceae bacterium]